MNKIGPLNQFKIWSSDPDRSAECARESITRKRDTLDVDSHPEALSPIGFESLASWHGQPIPDRQWGVVNRVPACNVTLFSGDGGLGKTILLQQLQVTSLLRREWLGIVPAQGPCMGIYCEEDKDELHRRFERIAAHYGAGLGDLPDIHVKSLVGEDAVLAVPERSGIIRPTDVFFRLLADAKVIRPAFLILDNAADIYAGSEIDRVQVCQFVGLLRRLAMEIEANTSIILTSHPSVTGLNSGSGFSGSTAWHASVRSRLYLRRPKAEGDQAGDSDERVLEVKKSNYGPAGEAISLRWQDGVFVSTSSSAVHWIDRQAERNAADELFLRLLAKIQYQGRNASSTKNAPTYAPALFADDPEAKVKGIRKAALADAMNRLFSTNKIEVQTYGKPSRPASKIVAKVPS